MQCYVALKTQNRVADYLENGIKYTTTLTKYRVSSHSLAENMAPYSRETQPAVKDKIV